MMLPLLTPVLAFMLWPPGLVHTIVWGSASPNRAAALDAGLGLHDLVSSIRSRRDGRSGPALELNRGGAGRATNGFTTLAPRRGTGRVGLCRNRVSRIREIVLANPLSYLMVKAIGTRTGPGA